MIPQPGTQLWRDVRWRRGWRIQTHSRLPVSRLLDPHDVVRRRGTLSSCEQALDDSSGPIDTTDHLVVILHGLGRTRYSMRRIDSALRHEGYSTARLDYPSTRDTIQTHAEQVSELLDHGPQATRISFVTHSLGGLIVRQLLSTDSRWRQSVHRIVMLAPPNQGAALARTLDNPALRAVMGPSFVQIVDGVPTELPVPEVPVSIVAGRIGGTDTDGLVTVEETKLAKMREHTVVPSIHTFVMNHPEAIAQTVAFLSTPDGC